MLKRRTGVPGHDRVASNLPAARGEVAAAALPTAAGSVWRWHVRSGYASTMVYWPILAGQAAVNNRHGADRYRWEGEGAIS